MTALPVAYYLKELSGEQPRHVWRGLVASADAKSDLDIELSDAHTRGVLEGRAAAQVEFDSVTATRAVAFEQKLAAERQKWAAEEGERLSQMISSGIEDLESRISSLVSEVLRSFVGERVRGKAIDELSQTLNTMLTKGEYSKVIVSGPADLTTEVERRLSTHVAGVTFVEAEGVDLVVNADDTILATRIGAWLKAIGDDDQ